MCPTWTQIKSTPGVSTGDSIKESYTVEGIVKGATMNNEEKILQILAEIKSEQTEMRDLLQKVAVTQEAVVLPRLDLLAEGHQNLLDTLAPKSRMDELAADVDTLKTVVRLLTHDVAELKKAQ